MKEVSMKEIIPNWLDNPRLAHVLACCLRSPGGECHVQVAGTEPASADIERAMMIVTAIVPVLTEQRLLPGQMVWNFADGKLYYAVKADGVALGVYCKQCSDSESATLAEFVSDFLKQK